MTNGRTARLDDDQLDPRPMSDRVYDVLRHEIENGVRPPLSRLVQDQIATELSISRTPIRVALGRLEQSGLVTWIPGRGYLVSQVEEREIHDVRGVREALELAALTAAIPHYTPEAVAELRSVYQEMVDAAPTDDYLDLTRRFHLTLVSPCPNQLLLKYLDEVWHLPVMVRVTGRYSARDRGIGTMISEHGEIVDALGSDDPSQAVELLATHISHVHPDDLTTA